MTIGALAHQAGVGVETVRYYQRRGLLATPDRNGGTRRYGDEALRRLRFIRQAQGGGFTLEEIGRLLSLDAGEDRDRARAMAEARITRLDEKIAELQAARTALERLAGECRHSEGPCPILTAFEGAWPFPHSISHIRRNFSSPSCYDGEVAARSPKGKSTTQGSLSGVEAPPITCK